MKGLPQHIAAIRARRRVVVGAPWVVRGTGARACVVGTFDGHAIPLADTLLLKNTDFIAHAPDDVEFLLEQYERHNAALENVVKAIDELRQAGDVQSAIRLSRPLLPLAMQILDDLARQISGAAS